MGKVVRVVVALLCLTCSAWVTAQTKTTIIPLEQIHEGMSGSPVYFDGKLAGAIAFRIGEFSRSRSPVLHRSSGCLRLMQATTTQPQFRRRQQFHPAWPLGRPVRVKQPCR